jgi:hypothetical protein
MKEQAHLKTARANDSPKFLKSLLLPPKIKTDKFPTLYKN